MNRRDKNALPSHDRQRLVLVTLAIIAVMAMSGRNVESLLAGAVMVAGVWFIYELYALWHERKQYQKLIRRQGRNEQRSRYRTRY